MSITTTMTSQWSVKIRYLFNSGIKIHFQRAYGSPIMKWSQKYCLFLLLKYTCHWLRNCSNCSINYNTKYFIVTQTYNHILKNPQIFIFSNIKINRKDRWNQIIFFCCNKINVLSSNCPIFNVVPLFLSSTFFYQNIPYLPTMGNLWYACTLKLFIFCTYYWRPDWNKDTILSCKLFQVIIMRCVIINCQNRPWLGKMLYDNWVRL